MLWFPYPDVALTWTGTTLSSACLRRFAERKPPLSGPRRYYPACMPSSLAGSTYAAWLSCVFPCLAFDTLAEPNQSFCNLLNASVGVWTFSRPHDSHEWRHITVSYRKLFRQL